jgi:hypothetical protein
MLSAERQAHVASGGITASELSLICGGTERELYDHWLERIGDKPAKDLSDVFEVRWGKHNEAFVLDAVQKRRMTTIGMRQAWVTSVEHPWLGATLDGLELESDTVVECKILDPYLKPKEIYDYHSPQLAAQMHCRGTGAGLLVVQQGNHYPSLFDILVTPDWLGEVLARGEAFHQCIKHRLPPCAPPPMPVPPAQWRTVDLADRPLPNWGPGMMEHLGEWEATRFIADRHKRAREGVKELAPPDVGRIVFGGITVKRTRSNNLIISTEG